MKITVVNCLYSNSIVLVGKPVGIENIIECFTGGSEAYKNKKITGDACDF